MTKASIVSLLGTTLMLAAWTIAAPASTTLEREFHYGPERFALEVNADGSTRVGMRLSAREYRPGRPDLPLVGERVELPPGTRLVALEIVDVQGAALARGVRLPSALVQRPGLGPEERTTPDPAWFQHAGFVPEQPVEIGAQGFERGRNVAYLQVAPVRWDPSSGALERLERVRVRLVLESSTARPLERERIVPEWEDGAVAETGTPTGARAAEAGLVRPQRRAEPFKPTQLPSVLGSPVAYVIVTSDAMASTFQQLADWKTQSGVPAVVRSVSFIKQEYPFGADDGERIRMFIRDAYSRWGAKWVLLGGDSDVIPVRQAYTTFYGGESIATDLYYQCLDGNWNADGDSLYGEGYYSSANPGDNADLLPEVYVGRAPASTAAQAQLFVNKTLHYVKQPVNDYLTSILFFAEVLFPQDWLPGDPTSLDGAELIDFDILPILDTVPWIHYVRLYENYTDSRWRPGSLLESKHAVLDSLNRGYNVAVHVGHGYRNVMHVGDDDLTNSDAMALSNGDRLINLYAINCTSNAIDFPCIGKAFLQAPNGGAVTNIGSTRFDFPTAGRAYQKEYFKLLYQDSVTAVGEAGSRQKLPFVGFSNYDGVNRWTQMTLLLLGDPELRIYTSTPRTLSVTHAGSLLVSDTTLAVHVAIGGVPLYGARVTLYKPGDELASVLTDGAGDVTLPVYPDTLGSFKLTVTGFNCRPYQATIAVTASARPALAERPVRIDDSGAGGTVGNGNGVWDAGETVDLYPLIRNTGGSAATAVTGLLSTTDGTVSVIQGTASYGTVAVGDTANATPGFRVSIPFNAPDQREIPFALRLFDSGGGSYLQHFELTVRAPELRHNGHGVVDMGGTVNGRPEPGETVSYYVKVRNLGTGLAQGVSVRMRNLDGKATVTDSTSSLGDLLPGQEVQGDALVFVPDSASAKLLLIIADQYGDLSTQTLDLGYPATPTSLFGVGAASSISLTWARVADADLLGYNIYRSSSAGGPFVRVNPVPTERTAYFQDGSLSALTRYFYKVASADSSGNESTLSAAQSASTNPPTHAIFPIPMGRNTPSSVAVDHLYAGYPADISAGADVLYLWHHDGSTPVDADGSGASSGDFTTQGSYYAGGPSFADIDGGSKEVIAATWDDMRVYVFDLAGNDKPGWPAQLADAIWSGVAVGDLLGNGQKALVLGSNGNKIYALRANGTEWMDGDGNPATFGVFKVLGGTYNFGTPALAPLEGNGQLAIIYASTDGKLYAWRADGSNVPGFPVTLSGGASASVAVGSLDGPSGPLSIVVGTQSDYLYAVNANGTVRSGFPMWMRLSGTSKTPSPALADMNNDGYLDIVQADTRGGLYVVNRNGYLIAPWSNIRYSTLTSGASESSPVVADINGDGRPDIVMGDENGQLAAISGIDATMLPGFPIQLGAEVRGTPAVCDCDGDGKTEIVAANWDKNLYVWDYDFSFSPGHIPPWPQFHHDAARTGYAGTPVFVGVDDDGAKAPPRSLELAAPAPNPASGATRLWYGIPAERAGGDVELAIYDLAGRRVRVLERGIARPGRHSVAWDLRDESGATTQAGVYFARLTLGPEVRTRKLVVVR